MVFQLDLGCENECSHCVNHKLIQEIVRFDVDKLVEDIEFKHKNYNVSNFVNIDPNSARYDLEIFLEKIIKKRLDINLFFYGGIQPDKVTKILVALMKQAHVKGMTLPRELDNSLNKQLQKKYTSKDFHKAVKLFKQEKYGFSGFHCAFPFALKDDCLFEIASIIKEVREIGAIPEIASIAFIPGTVEYNRHYEFLKGENLEELNWALWPTLDSAEKIQTYALYYNLAHGNRFKAPWRVKSWHIYNAAGAGHQIVLF